MAACALGVQLAGRKTTHKRLSCMDFTQAAADAFHALCRAWGRRLQPAKRPRSSCSTAAPIGRCATTTSPCRGCPSPAQPGSPSHSTLSPPSSAPPPSPLPCPHSCTARIGAVPAAHQHRRSRTAPSLGTLQTRRLSHPPAATLRADRLASKLTLSRHPPWADPPLLQPARSLTACKHTGPCQAALHQGHSRRC